VLSLGVGMHTVHICSLKKTNSRDAEFFICESRSKFRITIKFL